jgi:branched-chain amino acid transport system permease protein
MTLTERIGESALWRDLGIGLVLLAIAIIRGPLGHAFRALRDNDAFARTRGIDRVKYQVLVFALSGFFTGLMGAFYAGHYKTFGPTVLDFSIMLTLLAMMVVGGLGRPWGPVVGCALMMIVDDRLKTYAEWRTVGMGAITIFFIVIFRQGVVGLIEDAWRRLATARAARAAPGRVEAE